MFLPLVYGVFVFGPCFVMHCLESFLDLNHLDEEERKLASLLQRNLSTDGKHIERRGNPLTITVVET